MGSLLGVTGPAAWLVNNQQLTKVDTIILWHYLGILQPEWRFEGLHKLWWEVAALQFDVWFGIAHVALLERKVDVQQAAPLTVDRLHTLWDTALRWRWRRRMLLRMCR